MVDHMGDEVDGDELVAIIASSWKKDGYLKSNTVVGTKMTNLGIRKALAEQDINFIEANVGDRYVMEELIQNHAVLGGEGSGHIICLNKSTSGDAIIAALQVLEVIAKSGKSLHTLKNNMTKFPQILINVKTNTQQDLINNKVINEAIKSVEKKLSNSGRVLIRKSGTEPLIRVMVESDNLDLARESANYLAEIIKTK
jgi:phosphoglucosamine mutase